MGRPRAKREHDPIVFNCTPQIPYSDEALGRYLDALEVRVEAGRVISIDIRHDGQIGTGPCPNCGSDPD
jgi:hypothetical protein